jgi:hypothetical protein
MQYDVIHYPGFSLVRRELYDEYVTGEKGLTQIDLEPEYMLIKDGSVTPIPQLFEEALRLGLDTYLSGGNRPGTTFSSLVAGFNSWNALTQGSLTDMKDVLYDTE